MQDPARTTRILVGIIVFLTLVILAMVGVALGIIVKVSKKQDDVAAVTTTLSPPTANRLVASITVDQMMSHLNALQRIADTTGGTRAIHTEGFHGTLDYITQYLTNNTDLKVQRQDFNWSTFDLISDPTFSSSISGTSKNYTWGVGKDFYQLMYSGNSSTSSTSARVTIVPNFGCNPSDWNVPNIDGTVALVAAGGGCLYRIKTQLAPRNLGGLLIYNLGTPNNLFAVASSVNPNTTFPVISVSHSVGMQLMNAANDTLTNTTVTIQLAAEKEERPVGNICADTRTGDPTQTILIGGHSDSVPAGAGINDNGSGSAAIIVLATNIARLFHNSVDQVYKYRVRFCWWGAEEVGLRGAEYHRDMARNTETVGERISDYLVNLNYDMLASPNYMFGIYNGSSAPNNTPANAIPGSIRLTELFRDWFISQSLPWTYTDFSGRSDYGPFLETGIVASGLFSGAEDRKSKIERDYYDRVLGSTLGGIAETAYDSCYHLSCDTVQNINQFALQRMTQAAAYVLEYLGRLDNLQDWLYPKGRPETV
ncbi:unnamed protein product [Didymodactylos carnosus]|uniref:Peptidase M28 domain-containing protein n=1 Tax=Didymodactylos carnosus TaxID=1234261 RepID=A0A814ZCY3_9BILA|nr:unnamed protein product [Didymodactylos carnosus]CAF4005730.1 unnamed protein product [Didymodactylos carnosus]